MNRERCPRSEKYQDRKHSHIAMLLNHGNSLKRHRLTTPRRVLGKGAGWETNQQHMLSAIQVNIANNGARFVEERLLT